MFPHLYAFPLILNYVKSSRESKTIKAEIRLPNGIRAFLIHPQEKNPQSLPGIYLQHGMSVMGIDDPRILTLAENLSQLGFSIILPELTEVRSLNIQTNTIQNIQNLVHLLHSKKDWYNGKKLGFLSASFSGGMGLISISKPATRKLIDSIMLIGAYSDFLDTLPFVFSNFHRDNYGVFVLLFNFIDAIEPKLAKEIKILAYEAACDNALHRTGEYAMVPKLLKDVSKSSREFFYQIESNEHFRTNVGEKIAKAVGDLPHKLSPYHQLEEIHCPVVLLHGEDDPVISPEESRKLSLLLSKKQVPFLYRTSSAITHGDNLPIHSQIFGVPALLETFGTFIQNMKT